MAREIHVLPSADNATPRQVRAATVGFVLWAGGWAGVASWVALDISRLKRISADAIGLSHSLRALATALSSFDHVSFIGGFARSGAAQLNSAAYALHSSGVNSSSGLGQLSVLLGLAIALIPVLPFGVLLVRLHLERRRESAALRNALAAGGRRRQVAVRYLAERGMINLPYHELAEMTEGTPDDPERLARAELDRLGLSADWSEPATADKAS